MKNFKVELLCIALSNINNIDLILCPHIIIPFYKIAWIPFINNDPNFLRIIDIRIESAFISINWGFTWEIFMNCIIFLWLKISLGNHKLLQKVNDRADSM